MGNYSPIVIGHPFLMPVDDSGNANNLAAWMAPVVPKNGKVESLFLYVANAAGNVRGAVYAADGAAGVPGTLLAESASIAAVAGWLELPLTVPLSVNEGDNIWLATNFDDNALGTRINGTGSGNSQPGYNIVVGQAFGAMPAAFPGGGTTFFNFISLYARLGL